ncbi:unnamed protein product [Eruca vesicaria subsp. sativa]|uniref:Uncharacterized protein n=1 Tax=Eruca vesicaria subsp. sativa TaxID=29727 RepID=A0ABC8KYD8_ERUVS|nr:unnamed protein product [Eruca vesicaria subsp. sativa]
MEERELSLVPEWLRSAANGSGVGNKNHNQSSSAGSDSSLSHSMSRNPRTKTDVNSVRSPFRYRSSSTNGWRRFSTGSTQNAYRNFYVQGRGRGKDWRKEKDRLTYIDPWDDEERNQEQLRRSNSMKTRTQDDHLGQGFTMGFIKNGRSIYNRNRMPPGTSHATSSRDFPCLIKTEERNEGGPEVVRISSPGLNLAVQKLSVGDSGLTTCGEGWSPAPENVPNVIEKGGSNLTGQNPKMAEALLLATRTGTLPQIQKHDDRALKQSRQLIPVVPSSDKSKTKPMVRSGAIDLSSFRNTHKHSFVLLGNLHSNYGSQIKPDTTKKLVILKPAVKESGSPSRITNSLAAGLQMITAPSAPFITSVTRTQSRNAFYSALKKKKKTSTNISTSSCIFSSVEEKADISKELVANDPSSVQAAERNGIVMERVERVSEAGERDSCFELADLPDEKEAEFLRSLGWDENNSEVEALTDEEISAFYKQHKELKPSLMSKLPISKEATENATPNS